jgi:ferric-dicitrate binding protein FerR (iron transport regulator)
MDNMQTESLFEKLANRKLSGEDIEKLAAYFQEKTASGEADKYFLRIWDECHSYNTDIQSEVLLDKIQRKLNISHASSTVKHVSSGYLNRLKYASIFIVAFAMSWFLNNQFKRQSGSGQEKYTGNHEVTVSLGSKSKIKLPDGSVVNLNSGSKLTYPAVFNDRNRHVFLEGEAYFEVNTDSLRPFYVNTSDITIKVTGTSFNVKSYPESNTIETTLVSGSLEISGRTLLRPDKLSLSKHLLLKPNQKAVYIKDMNRLTLDDRKELKLETNTAKISKLALQDHVDTQPLTAWKDNKLIFNNEKFEDLAVKLERWYDVKITIKARGLRKERFTGTFENETTEQVLNALMIAEPFEYTMDKNEIIIFDSKIKPQNN